MKKTSDDALTNFSYAILYHTSIYMSRRILQCILYKLGAMSMCPRFLRMFFLGSSIHWMKCPFVNMSLVSFIPVSCVPICWTIRWTMLIKNCPSYFQRHFFTLIHFLRSMYSQICTFFFSFSFSVSYIFNHIHTVHSSISIRRGLSPFLHYLLLIGKNGQKPLWDSNSGLP